MSTFAVGEIAIIHAPELPDWHGTEVAILSPLRHGTLWIKNQLRTCWYHLIDPRRPLPQGWGAFSAPVDMLRKRRPPQDWARLCQLDAAPVDAKSTLEVA